MKKALFWLLAFTYCLPQTLVGLVIFLISRAKGCKDVFIFKHAVVQEWPWRVGAISFGAFIFMDNPKAASLSLLNHERAHSTQNLIFGPLYLLVIGLPSILWANCFGEWRRKNKVDYFDFWTEKWADKLGGNL